MSISNADRCPVSLPLIYIGDLNKHNPPKNLLWTVLQSYVRTIKIYASLNVPLPFICPIVQFQYGAAATLPITSASKFGILGVKNDLLLITDSCHGNKMWYVRLGLCQSENSNLICLMIN